MSNPRDPYNEFPDRVSPYEDIRDRDTGGMWGWIAGGVVVALLLLVFAFGAGNGDRTASTTPPTSTSQPASPPLTTGRRPGATDENTGAAPVTPPASNQ